MLPGIAYSVQALAYFQDPGAEKKMSSSVLIKISIDKYYIIVIALFYISLNLFPNTPPEIPCA